MSEDVNIEVLDGGLGLVPSSGDEIHAVIGTSSEGDDETIVATRSIANLIDARGRGPGVQAAALAIKQTGKTVLFCKAPEDAAGTKSAVDSTGATGTSVHTVSGDPLDAYAVRWKWTVGGTRGTAGARFQVSLDDGETWSPERPIGTAITYAIPDTGLTVEFAAGTFVAGDVHRFTTTAPSWAVAGIQACIAKLKASVQKFRLIHLVGDLAAADAVTLDVELEDLALGYRYTGLLGHVRDFETADTDEAGWIDAISTDYAAVSSRRLSVTAGHYQIVSPIDGVRYRRPLSFVAAARLMGRPIQEHAGRVRTGALKGIFSSSTDGKIYHDERTTPGLDAARFFTARTRIGRPGWFVKEPRMMAPPGSDFEIWPHRSVTDKVCDITYEVLVDVLNDDLQLDPATGFILEKEAKAIESRLRSAYRDGITSKRAASSVTGAITRDENILTTKTLKASTRTVPKGYVKGIDADVGFTNPALELG